MTFRTVSTLAVLLPALAACGTWFGESDGVPLPGERLPVLTFQNQLEPDPRIADLSVRLPRPTVNTGWPQAGGVPGAMSNFAAPGG